MKKIFSIILIQIFLFCNINLQDAFSLAPVSQIKKQDNISLFFKIFYDFFSKEYVDLKYYIYRVEQLKRTKKWKNNNNKFYEYFKKNILDKEKLEKSIKEKYKDPRIEIEILGQNSNPKLQSIYEGIDNSLDALGYKIGMFGKGIKQTLAWLENEGDRIDVYTKSLEDDFYHLSIVKASDTYLINIIELQGNLRKEKQKEIGKQGTILEINLKNNINKDFKDTVEQGIRNRFLLVKEANIYLNKNNIGDGVEVLIGENKIDLQNTQNLQDKKIDVEITSNKIIIKDKGKGMNIKQLSSMFVPKEGDKEVKALANEEEEKKELEKIVLAKKELSEKEKANANSIVSFARNNEVITSIKLDKNINKDAIVNKKIIIDIGKFLDVSESRDKVIVGKNFHKGIMGLIEKILENKNLSDIEKLKYINTIVNGIEGLVLGNQQYKKEVEEIRKTIYKIIDPIIKKLEEYIILPQDKRFSNLDIRNEKVIFLNKRLFDWNDKESLIKLGAKELKGISIKTENIDKTIYMIPFKKENLSYLEKYHKNWYKKELPVIKLDNTVIIPNQLGVKINELNEKRIKNEITKDEEKEFNFQLKKIDILIRDEVETSYEVNKTKEVIKIKKEDIKSEELSNKRPDFLIGNSFLNNNILDFSPDGKYIIVKEDMKHYIVPIDKATKDWKKEEYFGFDNVDFSPDSKYVAVTDEEDYIFPVSKIKEINKNKDWKKEYFEFDIFKNFSSDSKYFVVTLIRDIYKKDYKECIVPINEIDKINKDKHLRKKYFGFDNVVLSPDSRYVAVTEDQENYIFPISKIKEINKNKDLEKKYLGFDNFIDFSPDSKYVSILKKQKYYMIPVDKIEEVNKNKDLDLEKEYFGFDYLGFGPDSRYVIVKKGVKYYMVFTNKIDEINKNKNLDEKDYFEFDKVEKDFNSGSKYIIVKKGVKYYMVFIDKIDEINKNKNLDEKDYFEFDLVYDYDYIFQFSQDNKYIKVGKDLKMFWLDIKKYELIKEIRNKIGKDKFEQIRNTTANNIKNIIEDFFKIFNKDYIPKNLRKKIEDKEFLKFEKLLLEKFENFNKEEELENIINNSELNILRKNLKLLGEKFILDLIEKDKDLIAGLNQDHKFKNRFYENLITNLFQYLRINDLEKLDLDKRNEKLLLVLGLGYYPIKNKNNEKSLEIYKKLQENIKNENLETQEKFINFLNVFTINNPDKEKIVLDQIEKFLTFKSINNFIELLDKIEKEKLLDYANTGVILKDKIFPYIVFLTNKIDDLLKERESKKYIKEEEIKLPDNGIAISQLIQIVNNIDYLKETINNKKLPKVLKHRELEILRDINAQRENGAYTAEATQNARDENLKSKIKNGKLKISYYLEKRKDEKKVFVEEFSDNGNGALKEFALLIPKSTKDKENQKGLTGFYGTGKFTFFEDVDELEIINNNGKTISLFKFKVSRTENGNIKDVRLVEISKLSKENNIPMGVMVRRIKYTERIIPELERLIAETNWKQFAGMVDDKDFKIVIEKTKKINEKSDEVIEEEIKANKKLLGEIKYPNFGKIRIYTVDGLCKGQIIDKAGLRVSDISDKYLELIDSEYRKYIKDLDITIQIPLPLIRNRSAFQNEGEYLKDIQKYIAISFYKALSYKARFDDYTFGNLPLDWRTNDHYSIEIKENADIIELANKINKGQEIDFNNLKKLSKGKDKILKLILMLKVPNDWNKPEINNASLLDEREAIMQEIRKDKNKGENKVIMDKDMKEKYIKQAKIIESADIQGTNIEKYIIQPKDENEKRLKEKAEEICKFFGIEQVYLVKEECSFNGLFMKYKNKNSIFLNIVIFSDDEKDEFINTVIHELSHLLEKLRREDLWNNKERYMPHATGFTHDTTGDFAKGMKYISAVTLFNDNKKLIGASA